MRRWLVALCATVLPAWNSIGSDVTNLSPNPDFTKGVESPSDWKVAQGMGKWVDHKVLEINGSGRDSEFWQSTSIPVKPGGLYRFRTRARRLSGSGTVITGPSFCNRDVILTPGEWTEISHGFRVPDTLSENALRLGVWESTGAVQFDRVEVVPAIPIYRASGTLVLGDGESTRGGRYRFDGRFGHETSNFHRVLTSATAPFNSDRWCFADRDQVTYTFSLKGHEINEASVRFNVGYHVRGGCQLMVSRDGAHWRTLATQDRVGTGEAKVPSDLLPADTILVRLTPASSDSSFQVNELGFEASAAGAVPDLIGRTDMARLDEIASSVNVLSGISREGNEQGESAIELMVEAATLKDLDLVGEWQSASAPGLLEGQGTRKQTRVTVPAGKIAPCLFPMGAPAALGRHEARLSLRGSDGGRTTLAVTLDVPDFTRSDYGMRIESASKSQDVWWCDASHKIPRQRVSPTAASPAAELRAARNDREAVQVVIRPRTSLKGVTITASDMKGPDQAVLPASCIRISRVRYHLVTQPTDSTGLSDWWPDALPPLVKPVDLPANLNQPFWVLIRVPRDATPGDYEGVLALKAEGWEEKVPIRLHVWNVTLPERNHIETAFGFDPTLVFRYHNITSEADKRKILEAYFECFAEHRISPYDPTPLDPIRVNFKADANPPRTEVDFSAFDSAMEHAIETYHFTNFMLPVHGMGGGTYASRAEPTIGAFHENSPQYQAMFSSQVQQMEEHLRAKGWLRMAYIYWFDEPEPKDYAFVKAGMDRLKRHAPGLQRMLTEEPGDALAGAVDIWCPLTPNYSPELAQACRNRGERFWWYVCTGPKAPFCTLFIDHPATELRVWLWQTWQRGVVGNLVWTSNYWTSPTAFPDSAQDPYEDPMSYVGDSSLAKGTKAFWGNGDGRFFYPPEEAATPGRNGGKPILLPPVSSIRWEMLREGIEDYEMLFLLRDLLDQKRAGLPAETVRRVQDLLRMPDEITRDMTHFTTDPSPIYTRREEVARAIEEISKGSSCVSGGWLDQHLNQRPE